MKTMQELFELIKNAEQNAVTSYDKKRLATARRYAENADRDSGAAGRIAELLSHTAKSKTVTVGKQGATDTTVKILNENGKAVSKKAECKTSGGRVGALYEKNAPRFVVYSMDVCNSLVKVRRVVEPRVMTTAVFLAALEECGALKQTNGAHNELAIQATSKKWYNVVQTLGQPFNPERVYTLEELEG